jgi:arylsulfatase
MELYAAMVEHMDANIGKLIDYLKATNLYDNTLIIFMPVPLHPATLMRRV